MSSDSSLKPHARHASKLLILPVVSLGGGWDGETIVKLINGQIRQQTEYHYHYHYASCQRC